MLPGTESRSTIRIKKVKTLDPVRYSSSSFVLPSLILRTSYTHPIQVLYIIRPLATDSIVFCRGSDVLHSLARAAFTPQVLLPVLPGTWARGKCGAGTSGILPGMSPRVNVGAKRPVRGGCFAPDKHLISTSFVPDRQLIKNSQA